MGKIRHPGEDLFFEAVMSLKTQEDCRLFFEDICTIKELQSLYQRIGTSISGGDAARIIEHLKMEKIVSPDEASLMLAALSPQAVPLPLAMKDALCAGTLRSMILALAKRRS